MKLPVGDVLGLGRVVALPDDGGLVAALVEMPVDAVPGDVEDAVLEPFDGNVAGSERRVLNLGEGFHPVDAPGLFGPKSTGIADRARIHLAVLGLIDPCALGPFRRHIVDFLGHLNPPPMRPVNAATASRLRCCNDYASARPAPTSGTNSTFGCLPRHAQDQARLTFPPLIFGESLGERLNGSLGLGPHRVGDRHEFRTRLGFRCKN